MESISNENMHLYEKLSTLQHLLMKKRFARKGKGNGQIGDPMRGQGRILALLKIKDGVSTKDMSAVLGIRTSSLNELLAKLESKGFIEREQSEEDKRVMVVKLTEKGREVEQPAPGAGCAAMFDCLDEDEKQAFGDYLDRIIAQLAAEIGGLDDEGMKDMMRRREHAFKEFFGEEGRPDGMGGFPPFGEYGCHGSRGGHRHGPHGGKGCSGHDGHHHGPQGRGHRSCDAE